MPRSAPAKSPREISREPKQVHNDFQSTVKAFVSVILLALLASTCQLQLAPIYGHLLAKQAVFYTSIFAILSVGITRGLTNLRLQTFLPRLFCLLPLVWTPIATSSAPYGEEYGPLLAAFVTLVPVLAFVSTCMLESLDQFRPLKSLPIKMCAPVLLSALLTCAIPATTVLLQRGLSTIGSPTLFPAQVAMALIALAVTPSAKVSGAVTVVIITVLILANIVAAPNLSLASINRRFAVNQSTINWTLLERQYSKTGYVSVLENKDPGYRIMRCDHSFLGGEWLATNSPAGDPIYAVFALLEAVRLVRVPLRSRPPPQDKLSALFIGLGVGSAPKAMMQHGIATTVVELDPVVYEYAKKYFDFPAGHTIDIQDAYIWADGAVREQPPKQYDYIVHDVFTGGVEPLMLFTDEFLTNLRNLLAPHGVIAINYAGDMTRPMTRDVLHTVQSIFANRCRIFRDVDPQKETEDIVPDEENAKSANLVIFCPNPAGIDPKNPSPITFRDPTEADFLGSNTRRLYLVPNPELEMGVPPGTADSPVSILTTTGLDKYKAQQMGSARRHWAIMRKAVPDAVWNLY